ncbi:MAG: hypothetical protein HY954_13195 [Deltaproteobacteria bacterium]|nr:hypothetical protein [Deltaproteobacteria bacterium]
MKKIALVCLSFAMISCTTLTSTEKHRIAELESQGVRVPHEEIKSPGLAGALNILPGVGNFYLAIGTNESEHWLYGFLNLLAWPTSIAWGVPEAAIDASTINKRETVYFYTYGPGKEALNKKATVSSVPVSAPINNPKEETPNPVLQ